MKKGFLLLVVFFYSFFSYGQHTYLLEYKASFSTSSQQPAWSNSIHYVENGNDKVIYSVYSSSGSSSVDVFYKFTTVKPITNLFARSSSYSGVLTGCSSFTKSNSVAFNGCSNNFSFITQAINQNSCVSGSVSKFNLIKIEDFKVINDFNDSISNEFKICETKQFVMPTSCNYALEYKIPANSDWEELLPYGNNPSQVDVSSTDFAGLNAGETIFIRVRYAALKGEMNVNAYSETLNYTSISCSPQLQGFSTIPTSCSYSTDGSFELKLSRKLYMGEKLAVTIYTEGSSGNFDQIPFGGQQLAITSLTNNNDGTYSYQWPSVLPAGTFKVKYQTYTKGTGSDIDFSSLEHKVGSFTIGSPTPVSYTVQKLNDENCFDAKDGKIEITANGENGRTFEYQYYKNNVLQNTVWLPFTNTATLKNLSKAKYKIQVRDSKKCYAKF